MLRNILIQNYVPIAKATPFALNAIQRKDREMSRVRTVGATTRYLGPTDHRGSRIKVTMAGRSVTVNYDHSASSAHVQAVKDAWAFFDFGYIYNDNVLFVADSESGKGSVYSVEFIGIG